MKPATVKELTEELSRRSPKELLDICLRLSKFKKENKELLSYLLFESDDVMSYINGVKRDVDQQFEEMNKQNYFYIKKRIRKILLNINKHNRYTQNKEAKVELLVYFCKKLKAFQPSIFRSKALSNLYNRQIVNIENTVASLDEDLQYDYSLELKEL